MVENLRKRYHFSYLDNAFFQPSSIKLVYVKMESLFCPSCQPQANFQLNVTGVILITSAQECFKIAAFQSIFYKVISILNQSKKALHWNRYYELFISWSFQQRIFTERSQLSYITVMTLLPCRSWGTVPRAHFLRSPKLR